VVLTVSTLFFMCMSGRMIPGMAILTSAANPQLRGTFMTLNSSVQSAGMGVAAFVGGQIISRDAQGQVQNYWMAAVWACPGIALAIWLAGKLTLHGAAARPPPRETLRLFKHLGPGPTKGFIFAALH
jgi:predicted MFS family arabinose efflux permease